MKGTSPAIAPGAAGNEQLVASSSTVDRSIPVLASTGDIPEWSGWGGNRFLVTWRTVAADSWMRTHVLETVGSPPRPREVGQTGAAYGCAVPLVKEAAGVPGCDNLSLPTKAGLPSPRCPTSSPRAEEASESQDSPCERRSAEELKEDLRRDRAVPAVGAVYEIRCRSMCYAG